MFRECIFESIENISIVIIEHAQYSSSTEVVHNLGSYTLVGISTDGVTKKVFHHTHHKKRTFTRTGVDGVRSIQ